MSSRRTDNWYRQRGEGIDIRVRLTPKGGRDRIDGVIDLADESQVLAVRVRAVPEKGAANKALESVLARALGVARATVTVASGHKARLKTVHVSTSSGAGTDASRLTDALASKLAALAETTK